MMVPYLKIVAAMLVWSTWGLMVRWAGQPPVVVLFVTSLVASFTVPAVLKVRGEFDLSGVAKAWYLFTTLALASLVNNLTYFYALGHTTVSNAVFTHYTAPVFVVLLAPFLIGERIQRLTLITLPLAAAGMGFIVAAGGGLQTGAAHASGIAAGTASGAAYAVLIIISRRLSQMLMHHKAVVLILWITTVLTAPLALPALSGLPAGTALLLAGTGLFHSTLAPLLYYSALRSVIAQHAAILGYIEPLAAVPLAFLFLAERPSPVVLAGGALILLSGILVIRSAVTKERN